MSHDGRGSQYEQHEAEGAALAAGPTSPVLACCHCKETPCQPVLLGCLHSCCKTCLNAVRAAGGTGGVAGDTGFGVHCPLCEEVTFGHWHENAFVEAMLAAAGSVRAPDYCDVCCDTATEEEEEEEVEKECNQQPQPLLASTWCEECPAAMCTDCQDWHNKFSKKHRVVAYIADSPPGATESWRQQRKLLGAYRLHPLACLPHRDSIGDGSPSLGGSCRLFCENCERTLCTACARHCSGASHRVDRLGSSLAKECAQRLHTSVAQARDALASRRAKLLLRRKQRTDELLLAQIEAARARDVELLQLRRQAIVDAVDRACADVTRDLDTGYGQIVANAERVRHEAALLDIRTLQAVAYADVLLEPVAGGDSGSDGAVAQAMTNYLLDQHAEVRQRLQVLAAAAESLPSYGATGGSSNWSLIGGQWSDIDSGLVRSWIGSVVHPSPGGFPEELCMQCEVDRLEPASSTHRYPMTTSQPWAVQRKGGGHLDQTATPLPLQRPMSSPTAEPPSLLASQGSPTQPQQTIVLLQEQQQQLLPTQQLQQPQPRQQPLQPPQQQQQQQQQQQLQQPQQQQQQQVQYNVISSWDEEPWREQPANSAAAGKGAGDNSCNFENDIAENQREAINFWGSEMDVLCLKPATTHISIPPDCRNLTCTLDGRMFVAALTNGLKQYDIATGQKLRTWRPPMGRDGRDGCVNVVSILDDDQHLAVANINAEQVILLRRDAHSDALHEERHFTLDVEPWGMAVSGDHMAVSAACVVKKPIQGENTTFTVVNCQCSPGARLTLTSLTTGKTLLDQKLEYDISCLSLTANAIFCVSGFDNECLSDVNLCYVDAYSYNGTRLWRHMSQDLVSCVYPVPTTSIAYLAVPTAMAVRAINSTDGEVLADVMTSIEHGVTHPRALAMHLSQERPALLVLSFTNDITVHPVIRSFPSRGGHL